MTLEKNKANIETRKSINIETRKSINIDNKKNITGILLLDKPSGITSNAALQKIKKLYGAKKAGHTGSLDPLASGLLPICFGEATKFSKFLLEADKQYLVTMKLGEKTSTADSDGEITLKEKIPKFDLAQLNQVLDKFRGTTKQLPPMYSALKHQGQPLYKLACKGITVERKLREINISKLECLEITADTITLRISCSKGTYIRTLVEDIAVALGTVAHVIALQRLQVDNFKISQAFTLDKLVTIDKDKSVGGKDLFNLLLPIDSCLQHIPAVVLSSEQARALQQGKVVVLEIAAQNAVRFVTNKGKGYEFIGVGEIQEDGMAKSTRLMNTMV